MYCGTDLWTQKFPTVNYSKNCINNTSSNTFACQPTHPDHLTVIFPYTYIDGDEDNVHDTCLDDDGDVYSDNSDDAGSIWWTTTPKDQGLTQEKKECLQVKSSVHMNDGEDQ